jgi:hypothetical protein
MASLEACSCGDVGEAGEAGAAKSWTRVSWVSLGEDAMVRALIARASGATEMS